MRPLHVSPSSSFPTEEHFAESQKKSPFIHEKTIRKQLSTNRQPLPAQEVTAQSDMDSGMIYGTAWKEDDTSVYVKQALGAGFRAIDVAAQPKHYREDLVGEGIRAALKDGYVKREDIYIQTKFSYPTDPEEEMPHDTSASITDQVKDSVESSLCHLRHSEEGAGDSYLDCVILHAPLDTWFQTLEAWGALESFVPHKVRCLGISNISVDLLKLMHTSTRVKIRPQVVQNRFCERNLFDRGVRSFCRENDLSHQAFWVLTANPKLLVSDLVKVLAKEAVVEPQAALYALVCSLSGKASVLNGTTKHSRMVHDVQSLDHLAIWKGHQDHISTWKECVSNFKILIGEETL